MIAAKDAAQPYDKTAFTGRVRSAVAEAVQKQVDAGIDVVNDGELSKPGFSNYARERLSGLELRDLKPGEGPAAADISGRDQREFSEYFCWGSYHGPH